MKTKYKLRRLALIAGILGITVLAIFVLPNVDTTPIKRALGLVEVYTDLNGIKYDDPYQALQALFPSEPDKPMFVFIAIWTSNCPACIDQLRELKQVDKAMLVEALGINIGDSPQRVKEIATKMSLHFPMLTGMKRLPEGIRGTPYTELMVWNGQQWNSVGGHTGLASADSMLQAILSYVQGG